MADISLDDFLKIVDDVAKIKGVFVDDKDGTVAKKITSDEAPVYDINELDNILGRATSKTGILNKLKDYLKYTVSLYIPCIKDDETEAKLANVNCEGMSNEDHIKLLTGNSSDIWVLLKFNEAN